MSKRVATKLYKDSAFSLHTELPPPPPLPNYESHLSKISEGSDELDTIKDLADLLTQMDKIQSDLDYEMQS